MEKEKLKDAIPAPTPPAQSHDVDQDKRGCAKSFLNEEKDELDKTCEPTPAEKKAEYKQPEKEKEAGGEG
jgi:hypothetical protein